MNLTEEIKVADIASIDNKFPLEQTFQQINLPSLARSIFPVLEMKGPECGIFNIKHENSDLKVVRSNLKVFDSEPINTKITVEAVQDLENMYGGQDSAINYIAYMFKGLANDQENSKTVDFLKTNCKETDPLSLKDSESPETNMFFIIDRIARCTLMINEKYARTFTTWAVVPQKALGTIMSIFTYQRGEGTEEISKLFVTDTGSTKFFMNPNHDDDYIYVGIKSRTDPSCASAFFGNYRTEIRSSVDSNSNEKIFWIYNRFGLCPSPLHTESEPIMFKFKVQFS